MTHLARYLVAFVILLLGACSACSSAQMGPRQPTANEAVSRALEATVVLYRKDQVICGGQRVSNTMVLTAYHCVVAAVLPIEELLLVDAEGFMGFVKVDRLKVQTRSIDFSTYRQMLTRTRSGVEFHRGRVDRVDPLHDLALIAYYDLEQPSVDVRASTLDVGEEVFSIGHPGGLTYTYAHGWVSTGCRIDQALPRGCWSQVDITIHGGSSGGGLYDMSGSLVGVASAGYEEGQAFFSTPEHVSAFVDNR